MDYQRSTYFPFGFALRDDVWERYRVREIAPGVEERDAPIDTRSVRQFAQRVNEDHSVHAETAPPIGAGQMLTLGILTEVLRYLIDYYCTEQVPGVMQSAFSWTKSHEGEPVVDQPPPAFVGLYPPQRVQLGEIEPSKYLAAQEGNLPAVEATAREMVLLSLAMSNPAVKAFWPLFADDALRAKTPYVPLVVNLEQFFNNQPALDILNKPLFECLRAPMRAAPDSLEGQLDFIRKKWGHLLPSGLMKRLVVVQDILHEEYKERGGFVPGGMVEVMRFGARQGAGDVYPEFERFSADADWMSNVVMIAKSAYVWLDQLSKKYQRDIHRLDQIPDEELDQLARWGFNGLWLIGLWERSEASATIKRIMGNPDAVSSAYSLFDYVIAGDLGGEEAYENLRGRAWARGIRLASDMVPNHMGIFSRWVVEHPHWFVSLPYPPYPNYSFTGQNLSHDPRVGLYIEDGYWTHRDAAVVFKRVDHHTGDTRYIYHGNDGTSMPWNDTAQLNYLMPEVREAVIQTILHVARKFPIIRFDAAMTLAKKHFQRLWFPKAGDSGAIPSRAEFGMGREDFDRAMPEEFWREVVDRVAREVPDTLLLAEAFWMMEGYFVRTLGMHRVYNSAFMNMLKMEQNANYRSTVRNVLEFSPEILKRFVNFMNNPDERTAVEQFGKGDKYFGACLLMITMPGLPMFGHGQIEGFTEKYGMEYRRAYWDEHVDEDLVRRHEREMFPLMRRRYLFSGVEHFAFYDFHTQQGWVDENVFAYSNRAGDQRSLIFYNNAYNTTSGWAKISTGLNTGRGDEGKIISKSLADSLGLRREENVFYVFRDHRDGLEYIRHSKQLCDEGMFVTLQGYQWHAFIDWREIVDTDGSWGKLAWELEGSGVGSLNYERRERELGQLLAIFRDYFNSGIIAQELSPPVVKTFAPSKANKTPADDPAYRNHLIELSQKIIEVHCLRLEKILSEFARNGSGTEGFELSIHDLRSGLRCWEHIRFGLTNSRTTRLSSHLKKMDNQSCVWLAFVLLRPVGIYLQNLEETPNSNGWLDFWHFTSVIEQAFAEVFEDQDRVQDAMRLLRFMLRCYESPYSTETWKTPQQQFLQVFDDRDAQAFLRFNTHEGKTYLNREQLEWFATIAMFIATSAFPEVKNVKDVAFAQTLLSNAQSVGYDVDKLRERVLETTKLDD